MAHKRRTYQCKEGFKRSTWSVDHLSDARLEYLKKLYDIAFDCPEVSNVTLIRRALALLAQYLPLAANDGKITSELKMLKHARENWVSPWGAIFPKSLRDPESGKFLTFSQLSRNEIEKREELLRLIDNDTEGDETDNG